MPPEVREAEIFLFDLHLSLHPLVGLAPLQPGFDFLLDPSAYATTFAGAPVESPHFAIHALRRELKRNHFWRRYQEIVPSQCGSKLAERLWNLQVPFRCRPNNVSLALGSPPAGVESRVTAETLLWPSGWSSQLRVSLTGPMTLDGLRTLVAAVSSAKPFKLGGASAGSSQIFQRLAASLKEDLFGKQADTGVRRKIDRYRVVAITRMKKSIARYDPDVLPDAVRADLLGVLLGKEVSLADLAAQENSQRLLETRLRPPDFILTDFDRRAGLVSLSGAAAAGRSRKSLQCLAANVRTCALFTEALLLFSKEAAKPYASSSAPVTKLRSSALEVLQVLPDLYLNPFCKGLSLNRSGIL